ncbi:hypothetical protein [Bradyrhizobium cenepequi]|nr:hypothetical protein [Bradyrhizobium cenepequi]MCA6110810.1 hypothetical protein [Bradyrhizobium cenepequi]
MASPFKVFPDPQATTLRRICLAQAIVGLSALASTAVLLTTSIMHGLH